MVYLFKNRKIGKSENRAIFKEKMQMWTMPKIVLFAIYKQSNFAI